MSNLESYFPNHGRALKFPWSLYHKPLLNSLIRNLETTPMGGSVLIIGPGALQEIEYLKKRHHKISILDIDPRVLDLHKKENAGAIQRFYLVDAEFKGYPESEKFDFIYAKEVIEHLPNYQQFLKKLAECLKPSGILWLSTPNYGFFLLPLLEKTVLELIARLSGFTRQDIHPSKFSKKSFYQALKAEKFQDIGIEEMPFKFSLVGIAKKG